MYVAWQVDPTMSKRATPISTSPQKNLAAGSDASHFGAVTRYVTVRSPTAGPCVGSTVTGGSRVNVAPGSLTVTGSQAPESGSWTHAVIVWTPGGSDGAEMPPVPAHVTDTSSYVTLIVVGSSVPSQNRSASALA